MAIPAEEMLSPPPQVCLACLHTRTGATHRFMVTPSQTSSQQETGFVVLSGILLLPAALEVEKLSSIMRRDSSTSICTKKQKR